MKSDSELQSDVLDEIKWRPSIDGAHIGVTAKSGVVTLTGYVAHYAEKSSAEAATKGVYGVQGIANEIQVEMSGTHKRNDADIAAAALHSLMWDFEVPNDKITVVVKNGWVTLDGKVDWQYQKDAAEQCVSKLMGVKAVTNDIALQPAAKWGDVTGKIQDAFERNADIEARRIGVVTHEGKVTLSGSVASWAERDQAMWAAWSAPGVTSVDNQLSVRP
ncbi:MAG: BON domain-containing protein [Burkholderiaceae bacterium]